MAKLINGDEPREITYTVELTQSEVDMLVGIASDFLDNPERRVTMKYHIDDTENVPTKRGYEVLNGFVNGLGGTQAPDYDYFDYWEDYVESDNG